MAHHWPARNTGNNTLTTHRSVVLRRLAETPRRPNGFVRRSVAPDCRRRGDPGAHVAAVFGRRAGRLLAGRVVGKEFVRTMVAFLTNDWATVRARRRLCSPRRTLTTAPEPLMTEGMNRSLLGRSRGGAGAARDAGRAHRRRRGRGAIGVCSPSPASGPGDHRLGPS